MIVDIYVFCMALGLVGLFAMLALGFGHSGHGGHAGHHGGGGGHHALGHHSGGSSHGGSVHVGSHHGHGAANDASGHHGAGQPAGSHHGFSGRDTLLMLLAPRVWFSVLFGFGAAGCLLGRWMGGYWLAIAAVAAAWFFERWMVQPVWNFVLGFASAPAKTLESAMLEEAVAQTNFDAQGSGLISLTLDGQVRQMLGTLQDGAEPAGRVLAGDKLIVIGIDSRRNTCTVARSTPRPKPLF